MIKYLLHRTFKWAITILLLIGMSTSAHAQKPQRIVSMNLCTDQLLLLLADVETIQSISYLALEPHSSYMADEAKQYKLKVNHAIPEEIISLKPDLIVTGSFRHKAQTRILRELGHEVVTFPIINSLDDVWNNIRKMATLIHQVARGEAMIAAMQVRLKSLQSATPQNKIPALVYHTRGYTQGANTLMNELMSLSGWHNIALDYNIQGYRQIGLEEILLSQPKQLITSEYSPGTRSIGQQVLQHPVLEKLFPPAQRVSIDSRLLICGGPMNLEALAKLVEARHAL